MKKTIPDNVERLLLDFPKAAKALCISVSFLHSLDNSGKIVAPLNLGSRKLFSVESLKMWIALGCKSRTEMALMQDDKNK